MWSSWDGKGRDGEEKSKEMCVNVGVGAERERKESGLRAVRERKRFTQNETRLFHKIMATDK